LNYYGYYRSRRSLPSSSCDNRKTTVLFYRRYATTTRRRRRPVADSEAQSTRRRLHSVADLPASTTCRRLRHINDATVSWRRRSVCYRVDACLPSTTTILCRHRELATPLGYAVYFSCLLIFLNSCCIVNYLDIYLTWTSAVNLLYFLFVFLL